MQPEPSPMVPLSSAMFDMQFTAGLEYTPGDFRMAAEAAMS